jgi:hypothetical protein
MEENDCPKLSPNTVSTGMRGSFIAGVEVPDGARLGRFELFFDMLN